MRRPDLSSEWPWLIRGTLALMATCVFLGAIIYATGGQFPIPLYFVLHFVIPYSFLFALPLAFWGSFGFLWHSRWFGGLVLAIAISVGVLDGLWFARNWDAGYLYQGPPLTRAFAIANAVGIGAAAALAAFGLFKRSRSMIASAYLLLFEVLALIGFPSLGSYDT